MNPADLWLALGRAFLIAFVLTPIVRDIFRAYNVVDRPGKRKVHAYPIPRVGGIPIMAAYVSTILLLKFPDPPGPAGEVLSILPAATAIFLTGLIDDFFDLSPKVKLSGQIVAASLAWAYGIKLESLAGIALPGWVGFPLSVIWLLFTTNALNLIDGLDGLCAGMGFFATLAFFAAARIEDIPMLAVAAIPLAGALLGFLLYNFNPATVFLGDSGALLIGFLTGCYGLVWASHETTFASSLVPFLAMAVPLLDVLLSIARRSVKGQPVFQADRGHTHHRLLNRGLSVRQSAVVLYGFAFTGGLFAVLLGYKPVLGGYHLAVVLGFCLACWAGIRQLRYAEFEVAGNLLFKGGFRREVARELKLRELGEKLEAAQNTVQWRDALCAFGRAEGWHRVSVDLVAEIDSFELVLAAIPPEWSLSIRLDDLQSVQIEGASQAGGNPVDLTELTALVRRTFSSHQSTGNSDSRAR